MVAASVAGFSPAERPRVAVAIDGTLAAIHEPSGIAILELPGGAPFAEVPVDAGAEATDVAWVGAPPRLLVLARFAAHATVQLIDPYGPRTIAEVRLDAPMKLLTTVGAHALAVGPTTGVILTASDAQLAIHQFPARTMPLAAGSAAGGMVVALATGVEEWDPQTRMPRRKHKLPRPGAITALGGTDRVVWMTTQQDPTRVDVIPLVDRGQPRVHLLPEPIAHVCAHSSSDLIACLGADSGKLFIVDLDGRGPMRTIDADGLDRIDAAGLVVGRITGVLVAQAQRPIAIMPLEAPPEDEPRRSDTDSDSAGDNSRPVKVTVANPLAAQRAAQVVGPPPSFGERKREPSSAPNTNSPATGVPIVTPASASGAIAASQSGRVPLPRAQTPSPTPPVRAQSPSPSPFASSGPPPVTMPPENRRPRARSAATTPWIDSKPNWRDELCAWSRLVAAGSETRAPEAPAIDALADRLVLPAALAPALALLYAAHLSGERGAAPVDVARVLGHRWDEALGRGELAARGLAIYGQSRVALTPALRRALDELPPAFGTLVGEPGATMLLGPCCVIDSGPQRALAERCAPMVGGAVLVADKSLRLGDGDDLESLLLEGRAYGAAPMLRFASDDDSDDIPDEPVILVVADALTAERLALPRL